MLLTKSFQNSAATWFSMSIIPILPEIIVIEFAESLYLNFNAIYCRKMEFQITTNHLPHGKSFIVQKQKCEVFSVIYAPENYELILILSGCGKRIIGNNISAFENGDLILIGPNLAYCCEFLPSLQNAPPECFKLIISETLVINNLSHLQELTPIHNLFTRALKGLAFHGYNVNIVAQQIEQLAEMNGTESFIGLLKLLKTLTGFEDQEMLSLSPEFPVSYYKDINQIKAVYDFVKRNLQNTISLDTASGLLHMAPGSFCRFFKKRTGKSFFQYVKEIRIDRASRMLADTELPVAQIGFECGYNNLANFNFYFKSIMKMTPTEYRKNFR